MSLVALVMLGCSGSDDGRPHPLTEPPQTGSELQDLDPDPMRFEADLTAAPTTWSYADGVDVNGLGFGGQVPGPLIRVPVGCRVLIHFHNDLPEGFDTTVHWHGIEGNNAADGTATTQPVVPPGGSFDYSFVVTRPGLFWYHPHARGAQGVFDGLYGPLIVDDPDEPQLIADGVLPEDERVLVLSDLTEYLGNPSSAEVDNAMEIMNGTEGAHLLVNGQEDPVFEVAAGGAVRLRVVNTSITRFWRLSVPGHLLYRVGGQGGLLDAVRVEGGSVTGHATNADGTDAGEVQHPLGYDRGQILLAPAERADLVLVPQGAVGDSIELRWEDYARGRHGMWMDGDTMVMGDEPDDGKRPGEAVATFRLVEGNARGWDHAEGDPVLGAVGRSVGAIDTASALDWSGDQAFVLSEQMDMYQDTGGYWQMSTQLFIDGQSWEADHMAGPDQPEAPTAVHAKLGDTILWQVVNESHMAHPVHLHGFSYQPVSFVHTDEETGQAVAWDLGYDEYQDTSNLPGDTTMLIRVRLDDPVGDGGAVGRWMRHCHILQHGEHGMMSELIVDPK